MRKKYNTPHRSRVVKTRLSEDEYADFTARACALWYQPVRISPAGGYGGRPYARLSMCRRSMTSCFPAVGKLTAEYGRIGGNLNQIARYLNEYGVPYNTLSGEVRAAIYPTLPSSSMKSSRK